MNLTNLRRIANGLTLRKHMGKSLFVLALGLAFGLTSGVRAGQAAGVASVPFMAVFSGQVVTAPGGSCPALTGTVTGSGVATTFGQFTNAQTHCVDPNSSDPMALTDGNFTYTNANGDTIFGAYVGRLAPTSTSSVDNLYLIYGNFIIEGGTGAFAGASGGGSVTGVLNFATGNYSASDVGAISPPVATNP